MAPDSTLSIVFRFFWKALAIMVFMIVGVALVRHRDPFAVVWWLQGMLSHPRLPHAPDIALLAGAPTAVKVHVVCVSIALLLGLVQLVGPKGTTIHRSLGWTWVLAMLTAAIASIFIAPAGGMALSPFLVFTVLVLVGCPMLVYSARRHNVAGHRQWAIGLYVGGLIIAGLFAFAPGRLMYQMFFGA